MFFYPSAHHPTPKKPLLLAAASLLLLLLSTPALSFIAVSNPTPAASIDFGTWNSTGDVSSNVSYCILSVQGKRKSNNISPYAAKVFDRASPGAAYVLTSTATADTIAAQFSFTDLITSSTEGLSPNTYTTPQDETGAIAKCPGGNNGQITATLTQAALLSAPAGTYTGNFRLEVIGGNGNQTKFKNFSVTIIIPDLVQISNINDIDLGTYIYATGNKTGNDTLCVFRSGGSTYQITATGSGAGGAFDLALNTDVMPYTVRWNDGSTLTQLTTGIALTNRQNANSNSGDCNLGASNNATVEIEILQADLDAATQVGAYTGVLTLMLAPQ